jgi:NAD(P)-dependent dehydrogenase (short-subunit alcohol dehydrogenase family)
MSGVLIVTGGGRGIGAATARLAAERGWKVATCYLERREPAEVVVSDIKAAGGEALTIKADTASEDDVKRLFDAAHDAFGQVTGLVNNAALQGGPVRVADIELFELRRIIDVNLIGPFIVAREAVRRMSTERGGPGGVIVNISSIAARHGSGGERVHYSASKAAINIFTVGLAKEVGREGIRVNTVSPGVTATDMNPPEAQARFAPITPLGRAADPLEIARVILFALSPESSFMSGADILVAGGR